MKKTLSILLLVLITVGLFVSCNVGAIEELFNQTVSVTGVTLNKTELTLAVGSNETLIATVTPENAPDKAVTWASSSNAIATVDNNGKVTAVASGTATITVTTTDGSKTATCEVTVNPVTYTVTFNLNGISGTTPPSKTVEKDGKVTNPGNQTVDGLKLKEWYQEAECTNRWNFDTDEVTGNITLYAKWVETVRYVIGNNFPEKNYAWTNESGSTCYYDPWTVALVPSLVFSKTEPNGYAFVYLVNEVTKTTDGYTYYDSNRKFTITFNINQGELDSIEFDTDNDAADDIKAVEGTYTAPTATP